MMINYSPIGVIHTPFSEPKGTPVQSVAAKDILGTVEIYSDYVEGLKDIGGFSHLILVYHFHLVKQSGLLVKPFLGDDLHGIFATRSPGRPNLIGLSVVRLTGVAGNLLYIQDVDIVDKTPLLDIKPYIGEFDARQVEKIGWFAQNLHKLSVTKDDGRFSTQKGNKSR